MRRRQALVATATAVALLSGSAVAGTRASAPYTLSGPTAEASAWQTPGPGYTYSGGAGSVTVTHKGMGAQAETATLSWKMPTAISAEGSKGTLTLVAAAGSEVWAPGFQVNGVLVGCSGIKNTPSYGTGCAEGDHAAISTSLQPGKTANIEQDFLIKPGVGKVTVVLPGFSKQYVYTSTRNSGVATTTTASSSPGTHASYRYSAQAGMTHDHPIIKFFGTGGFTINHVPTGSNTTAGLSPTGSARVVLFPLGPHTFTVELAPTSVRFSKPGGRRTIEITYKIVKSTYTKCGAVGTTVVIGLVDHGGVDKLTFRTFCGQAPARTYEYDVDVSVSGV